MRELQFPFTHFPCGGGEGRRVYLATKFIFYTADGSIFPLIGASFKYGSQGSYGPTLGSGILDKKYYLVIL
jgi:NADH:ubiquinone oxidoreductase subunit 4 (subunit M)